ncbi:MAG: hypothetical protein ACYC6L_15845, partial [Anaerolineae bacterium]
VATDVLYYNELLTVIPQEDEAGYIRRLLDGVTAGWNLAEQDVPKARVRLRLQGYSYNRSQLAETAGAYLAARGLRHEPLDLSGVKNAQQDMMRAAMAEGVRERLAGLQLAAQADEVSRDEVLLAALGYIYGGKA